MSKFMDYLCYLYYNKTTVNSDLGFSSVIIAYFVFPFHPGSFFPFSPYSYQIPEMTWLMVHTDTYHWYGVSEEQGKLMKEKKNRERTRDDGQGGGEHRRLSSSDEGHCWSGNPNTAGEREKERVFRTRKNGSGPLAFLGLINGTLLVRCIDGRRRTALNGTDPFFLEMDTGCAASRDRVPHPNPARGKLSRALPCAGWGGVILP